MPIFTKILEQGKSSLGPGSALKPGAPNVRDWNHRILIFPHCSSNILTLEQGQRRSIRIQMY